jgi:hypothetical protein
MGLMDKVKDKAAQATEMAKDAAQKGQAKLNEVQSLKGTDGMLRDLGAAYYAAQTGRATPSTESEMTQLITALQTHESQNGALTLAPTTSAAGPTATPTVAPTYVQGGASAPPTAQPAGSPMPSAAPAAAASSTPPPPPPAAADPTSPPPPPPTAQTI